MSKLDTRMQPMATNQSIADRVAETLNILHDFPPLQPTGTAMEYMRKGKIDKYNSEDERDISMVTKMSTGMVFATAFSKSLDVTDHCEARTKFMEQYLRSSRSDKGWGIEKSIEMVKAVRPQQDEIPSKSRMERLRGILR